MDIVSNLCFSDDNAPNDAVVEKLMSYVVMKPRERDSKTMTTRELFLIDVDEAVDTTPVVRTFLLQQLLRAK